MTKYNKEPYTRHLSDHGNVYYIRPGNRMNLAFRYNGPSRIDADGYESWMTYDGNPRKNNLTYINPDGYIFPGDRP